MSTPVHNYVWPQGEDFNITFLYKEGADGAEVPVDLTGHSVRMDLQNPITKSSVASFDSTDPAEVTFGSGSTQGWVYIKAPRALSLPGGAIGDALIGPNPVTVYNYDIFIRKPDGTQKKLFRGTVTVEVSYTLWT